jgi:uncharacterized membrane protein YidH (DUF202 family)
VTVVRGDEGLANERTSLAWQRTALSLLAGAAIIVRLRWAEAGPVTLVALTGAIMLSGWVFLESSGRYRHSTGSRPRDRPRGGRAPLALTASILLMAGAELAAVFVP